MKYFDIPDKEFEELCNTEVDDLEFSVRTYNVLKRCGCETLADVAYLTVEEIQTAKNASQRALGEVQEKLAERNVFLMTQEEKQQILDGTDNPMVLRRQIMVLESREKKSQETIRRYAREKSDEWNEVKANRTRALNEARGIVRTSPYPIARLLESMYFGKSALEGCAFCGIFDLYTEYGCFLEQDSMRDKSMEHSCEECIETFLANYYWEKRMSAKLAAERGEAPKMIRVDCCAGSMSGRCPVCKQLLNYDKNKHYCFRCGTFLNWDEENWDEETRECMAWYMEDDDDEYDCDGELTDEETGDGDEA